MAGSQTIDDRIEELTRQVHSSDAFANAWIMLWMGMLDRAKTAEAKRLCTREISAWNKIRSKSAQALYKEINVLLAGAYGSK